MKILEVDLFFDGEKKTTLRLAQKSSSIEVDGDAEIASLLPANYNINGKQYDIQNPLDYLINLHYMANGGYFRASKSRIIVGEENVEKE